MKKLSRDELVSAVVRLRKAKEEVINIAMLFDMDSDFIIEVDKLQTQINSANIVIDMIDEKIVEIDFPINN